MEEKECLSKHPSDSVGLGWPEAFFFLSSSGDSNVSTGIGAHGRMP